jgi:hypothetical protein
MIPFIVDLNYGQKLKKYADRVKQIKSPEGFFALSVGFPQAL